MQLPAEKKVPEPWLEFWLGALTMELTVPEQLQLVATPKIVRVTIVQWFRSEKLVTEQL